MTTVRRPTLLHRAAAMERATWSHLFRWITRKPAVPAGATGFGYASAMMPVLITFIVVSAIEIPVVHLLIPWLWLEIIALIIGVWGLLWMFGLLAAVRLGPHLVDEQQVRFRHATSIDLAVPLAVMTSVASRLRSLESSRAVQVQPTSRGTALIIAVTGQTNVEVRLAEPITVELPAGPAEIVEVRCYADDPRAMAAAIRARLSEPSSRRRPG